jgi:predicted nucleic acid-binding protein
MNKLIVLDTNVLLSAALFKKSEIRQLLDTIRLKHTIVVSEACLNEFE